jgi:hypothetical protein
LAALALLQPKIAVRDAVKPSNPQPQQKKPHPHADEFPQPAKIEEVAKDQSSRPAQAGRLFFLPRTDNPEPKTPQLAHSRDFAPKISRILILQPPNAATATKQTTAKIREEGGPRQ